jgi:hypothetical protein
VYHAYSSSLPFLFLFFLRFWTSDLDPYLTAFTAAKQKILPVEWAQPDEVVTATEEKAAMAEGVAPGTTFFSFLVQVCIFFVILRDFTSSKPSFYFMFSFHTGFSTVSLLLWVQGAELNGNS